MYNDWPWNPLSFVVCSCKLRIQHIVHRVNRGEHAMTRKMIYLMLNSQHAHDASFISFNKKQQQIMQPCHAITNVRIVICVKNVLPRGNNQITIEESMYSLESSYHRKSSRHLVTCQGHCFDLSLIYIYMSRSLF